MCWYLRCWTALDACCFFLFVTLCLLWASFIDSLIQSVVFLGLTYFMFVWWTTKHDREPLRSVVVRVRFWVFCLWFKGVGDLAPPSSLQGWLVPLVNALIIFQTFVVLFTIVLYPLIFLLCTYYKICNLMQFNFVCFFCFALFYFKQLLSKS